MAIWKRFGTSSMQWVDQNDITCKENHANCETIRFDQMADAGGGDCVAAGCMYHGAVVHPDTAAAHRNACDARRAIDANCCAHSGATHGNPHAPVAQDAGDHR
jgi:hypothetical protein